MYYNHNGQCFHVPQSGNSSQVPGLGVGFSQLFGWLPIAQMTGHDEKMDCDKWSLVAAPPHNLTACLRGNVPIYLLRENLFPGKTLISFENFDRIVDPNELRLPQECRHEQQPCGNGQIVNMTVYVAHPEGNYNISGLGDAQTIHHTSFALLGTLWCISRPRHWEIYTRVPWCKCDQCGVCRVRFPRTGRG